MTAAEQEEHVFLDRAREKIEVLAQRFATGPESSPGLAILEESGPEESEIVARERSLQQALNEAELAWPDGPVELGGLGLAAHTRLAVDALLDQAGLPARKHLTVGLQIVAPALLEHASIDLQKRYLPGLFRGDLIGCQLFSEPDAGSDLAAVNTRARREGEDWVISGQKVWTSHAQVADIGEILVRTDPDQPRHPGLSMLVLDMHSPGVEVRPLRQMTGGAAFNEVFLDEVRVPHANVIGELGQGWAVARTSLMAERAMMATSGPLNDEVIRAVVQAGRHGAEDATIAHLSGVVTAELLASEALGARSSKAWGDYQAVSGPLSKLLLGETVDNIARLAREAYPGESLHDEAATSARWAEFVLGAPCLHIAGGTDEIQRNLIAQRGLGLPR